MIFWIWVIANLIFLWTKPNEYMCYCVDIVLWTSERWNDNLSTFDGICACFIISFFFLFVINSFDNSVVQMNEIELFGSASFSHSSFIAFGCQRKKRDKWCHFCDEKCGTINCKTMFQITHTHKQTSVEMMLRKQIYTRMPTPCKDEQNKRK